MILIRFFSEIGKLGCLVCHAGRSLPKLSVCNFCCLNIPLHNHPCNVVVIHQGVDVTDEELMTYISESSTMSKALEEYDGALIVLFTKCCCHP